MSLKNIKINKYKKTQTPILQTNNLARKTLSTIIIILLLILPILSGCTSTATAGDKKEKVKVNVQVNKCVTKDENGNNSGTIDHAQLGTGHSIEIPNEVGSKQNPGSVSVVDPTLEWLLSGVNATKAAEPCASIFEAWRQNGGNLVDGLAAIGNVPIVAVPQRVLQEAVGEEIFNGILGGSGVGCFIDIYYEDGSYATVIAGDTKNPSDRLAYIYNGEHWGHKFGSGVSLIEPWQSQDDYFSSKVPGQGEYHPELAGTMTKWVVYENKLQTLDATTLKLESATGKTESNNSSILNGATGNKKNTKENSLCSEDGTVKDDKQTSTGAQGAVDWAIKVANSRTCGYSQSTRQTVKDFDGTKKVDADCTSFVWHAWLIGGNATQLSEVSPDWSPATGSFGEYYPKAGFTEMPFSMSDLKIGDILWSPGHAAIYIGDNKLAEASNDENGGISGGVPGDQTQTSDEGEEDGIGEAHIRQVPNGYFSKIWRYNG